jgi:hypothetical protein
MESRELDSLSSARCHKSEEINNGSKIIGHKSKNNQQPFACLLVHRPRQKIIHIHGCDAPLEDFIFCAASHNTTTTKY